MVDCELEIWDVDWGLVFEVSEFVEVTIDVEAMVDCVFEVCTDDWGFVVAAEVIADVNVTIVDIVDTTVVSSGLVLVVSVIVTLDIWVVAEEMIP